MDEGGGGALGRVDMLMRTLQHVSDEKRECVSQGRHVPDHMYATSDQAAVAASAVAEAASRHLVHQLGQGRARARRRCNAKHTGARVESYLGRFLLLYCMGT